MKKALITGITGQDGSYLAELLLEKGYEVHGISRKHPSIVIHGVSYYECDIMDNEKMLKVINDVLPDEIYHLASSNSIAKSFIDPIQSFHNDCISSIELLESVRRIKKTVKIFNASSSEIFGNDNEICNELTIPNPNSPYGMSKEYVLRMYRFYREQYRMFIVNGILFNHESPRRRIQYVTRKISSSICKILNGQLKTVELGNIDSQKDFGYAKDFVQGMWLMLQQDKPDDYVLATGEKHSIREICEIAFSFIGLDYRKYVTINNDIQRNYDNAIVGDASKSNRIMNWKPTVTFKEMIEEMVKEDLKQNGVKS